MSSVARASLGFHGGNSMFELGRPQDMVVFFACLDRLTRSTLSETGRFVLLDRLFKRYLRTEDLDEAVLAMTIAKEQFRLASVSDVDLVSLGLDTTDTSLLLDQPTLAGVFEPYFDAFFHCVESYRLGKKTFGFAYNPVKVSRIDLPGFTEDKTRSARSYDELAGMPLWFPATGRDVPAG